MRRQLSLWASLPSSAGGLLRQFFALLDRYALPSRFTAYQSATPTKRNGCGVFCSGMWWGLWLYIFADGDL